MEKTMRILLYASIAAAIAWGLTVSPVIYAATAGASIAVPGGSCQLSIPTTNTGVRPKATGFRNESTTVSNFVYCPIANPVASNNNMFTQLIAAVYSINGAPHLVTCTAVVGAYDYPMAPLIYSSKSESVDSSDTPLGQLFTWTAADFGGTEGDPIVGSVLSSVTCSLTPQTAISFLQAPYSYDVGQ
ncbi:MAG: hypothetical protein QM719_11685 [Thermomonas sp.]